MGRGGTARLGDAAGLIPPGTAAASAYAGRHTDGPCPHGTVAQKLGGTFSLCLGARRGEHKPLSSRFRAYLFQSHDQDAQLQCVWFRGQQRQAGGGAGLDPLTGEVFDTPGLRRRVSWRNGLICSAGRSACGAPARPVPAAGGTGAAPTGHPAPRPSRSASASWRKPGISLRNASAPAPNPQRYSDHLGPSGAPSTIF